MNLNIAKKIFVAGHNGMVGSALIRALERFPDKEILVADRSTLDLTNQQQVSDFIAQEKPDYIFLAAAKVGGINANYTYPKEFLYDNLMIELNIINSALEYGVRGLLFLGSSCIYPKFSSQPIDESELLSGPLEITNEPYAIAKIAGIKLCQAINKQYRTTKRIDYRCLMPTNLYGPGDNYDLENSHVIPGLIRKIHEAKVNSYSSVKIWGSGTPLREFMHVDDLADACIHISNATSEQFYGDLDDSCFLNVGSGEEVSISELAYKIATIIGFTGQIEYDLAKPDGTPRKLLSSKRLQKLGWNPSIKLDTGLRTTYKKFLQDDYLRTKDKI